MPGRVSLRLLNSAIAANFTYLAFELDLAARDESKKKRRSGCPDRRSSFGPSGPLNFFGRRPYSRRLVHFLFDALQDQR